MQQRSKDEDDNDQGTDETREGLYQLLSPSGHLGIGEDPKISDEALLGAYRSMVLTRVLDEKLGSLQRQGRMGTYVSCAGQEAAQVGSVMALSIEKDWIFPMYRDLGMIIEAGVPLDDVLNRMLGNAEDQLKGRDLPNLFGWKKYHVVSFAAPIATHLPLATGYAIAASLRHDELVTLATFGDGATSSGEFHVAMNFAGVFRAPTIFVCENNQYAISVPVSKQTASETIAIKAKAYGFEGIRVDGNDLLAVYAATRMAVEKARHGRGPTLIECVTYRLSAHSTSDDWKRYRSTEEVELWRKRDPIKRLLSYLETERKIWSPEKEKDLRKTIESHINEVILNAERVPQPDPATLFEDVYSEVPEKLKEEQARTLRA